MVRGRTTGRGRGRGAAATRGRSQPEGTDTAADPGQPSTQTIDDTGAPVASTPGDGAPEQSAPRPVARRGATAQSTRGAASAGRFRPRNIRRDEAERDNLAREEEKKAKERAADERRARGRSRFRSKRSRGDTMGSRGGFGRPIIGASGPFSSGIASSAGIRSGGWGGGGGAGPSSGPGSFAKMAKPGSKAPPGFNIATSGELRETRINADKLHSNAPDEGLDSEDEAMMTAIQSRVTNVFPMGIYRKEHKEKEVVVATTAELEAAENANGEEESLWVDGQDPSSLALQEQPEEQGIWDAASKRPVLIKKEPDTEDGMDLDLDSKMALDFKEKKNAALAVKAKKIIPQDPEDKMIETDLRLLANELGAVTIEDGETSTTGPANKDGRMYLFQFPPILPGLTPGSQPQASTKVKQEPVDIDMLDDADVPNTPTPVDLTQDATNDNTNNGVEDELEDERGFMPELLAQGGMIGKLNVRKSGKVELDWGGRILELSPATGMNFLTTAVVVEENDEKAQPNVVGGDSIGMGKIMGRFVLAPTWTEEEEWIVSPEELHAG